MSDISRETTYEAQVEEAKTFMQQRLPQYVVNCLIASGFDTLPLLADMDVKSLDDVEQFCGSIQGQLIQNPISTMASGSFKFPPGHRRAILKFIEEVSNLQNEKKRLDRKRPTEAEVSKGKKMCQVQRASTCSDGKGASTCSNAKGASTCSDRNESSLAAAYGEVRRQVVRWQQKQQIEEMKTLKEHDHYEIKVKQVNENMHASLHCKTCGGNYLLAHDGKYYHRGR